jgi:hypothetical protein
VIFKQAYLSVFINTVLPLWGKRIKLKKISKGDKINLLSNKMQYQECHKYRLGHCLAVNGAQFEHLV